MDFPHSFIWIESEGIFYHFCFILSLPFSTFLKPMRKTVLAGISHSKFFLMYAQVLLGLSAPSKNVAAITACLGVLHIGTTFSDCSMFLSPSEIRGHPQFPLPSDPIHGGGMPLLSPGHPGITPPQGASTSRCLSLRAGATNCDDSKNYHKPSIGEGCHIGTDLHPQMLQP